MLVVVGRDHNCDVTMIFCGGTDHRWSANIDVFDCVFEGAVGPRNGGFKGIQIDDHQINRRNVVVRHHAVIRAQNSAMNFRVQRFNAAVHHLGKARVVRDFDDVDTLIAE